MMETQLGQYRVLDEVGRGGMGVVYLAEHVGLKVRRAVKVLPAELASSESFVKRFYTEARIMARLEHPGIVKVLDIGHEGQTYFLAMEFVEGPDGAPKNLQDVIEERGGKLGSEEVLDVVLQVCDALEYAHTYRDADVTDGVVHRDLKPLNILLDQAGRVKVSDFGLAKILGSEWVLSKVRESMGASMGPQRTRVPEPEGKLEGHAPDWDGAEETVRLEEARDRALDEARAKRTSTQSILGTYDFMSPEQRDAARAADVNRRSDIFALGVLAYRMLTARKPEGRFKLPSKLDPEFPTFWDEFVDTCLQPEPDDRYQTCAEIVKFLHTEKSKGAPSRVARSVSSITVRAPARKLPKVPPATRLPNGFLLPKGWKAVVRSVDVALDGAIAQKQLTYYVCPPPLSMVFCYVPSGEFLMGSSTDEKNRRDDETAHRISISKPFLIGALEVTNAQYRSQFPSHRSSGLLTVPLDDDDQPTVKLSWGDAHEFCERLRQRMGTGLECSLPTEAQWEYACRAGTKTPFPCGTRISTALANFNGRLSWPRGLFRHVTTPVGSFAANPWGLCDMHGNVWEWCSSLYRPYPFDESKTEDLSASGNRVLRGGAWNSPSRRCRCAYRNGRASATWRTTTGFRVVVSID